jgi:adenosine/AMP kinase
VRRGRLTPGFELDAAIPGTTRSTRHPIRHVRSKPEEIGSLIEPVAKRNPSRGSCEKEVPMELLTVPIEKPADVNVILVQSHFIKTVDDVFEALAGSSPQLRFGLAFCESSGPCLVRRAGNDEELVALAVQNALAVGSGHSLVVFLREGFPVNVLNALKQVPEVCRVYCATANPVEVVLAETSQGRGILGVIDGSAPKGVETEDDVGARAALLRQLGYKP